MRDDLLPILQQLLNERRVDRHVLADALRCAIESAAKKSLNHSNEITIEIDEETFEIKATELKEAVKEVTEPKSQISLEEARALQPEAQPGDKIHVPTTLEDFGRIATQTAKQIIIQRIRDAEREHLYNEFKEEEGEVLSGTVKRVHRGNVIVNLGMVEGILPYREQSPRESYAPGSRIKVYVIGVEKSSRGPQITLSRSTPAFVRKLFEAEVPEIYDGTIEIKAIAREAGNRTKLAVVSHDANVDPVGACVGMKGTRVLSIVDELSGEKIDIVRWSDNTSELVRHALSPAEISGITVDEEAKLVKVLVPTGQLSLAIGKKGQNARLASKLTGLQIEINADEVPETEEALAGETATEMEVEAGTELAPVGEGAESAQAALTSVPGIGPSISRKLVNAGFETLRQLRSASAEQLCAVPGIGEKSAQNIVEAVKEMA